MLAVVINRVLEKSMDDQQKTITHTWKKFLPKNAIVMTKKSTQTLLRPKLDEIRSEIGDCTRCKLAKSRIHIVFGEGNPAAELMFVGEGPGEQEDLHGRPFVGKAGQLLDRMIAAIGLERSHVYIANVVKCRPPGNRNPQPDEIESCQGFLLKQIQSIGPKVIVALGKFSAQTLLQSDVRISDLRGKFHSFRNTQLMPTFHPAYLLRNPDAKKEAWQDLQLVAKMLGLEIPKRKI